MNLNPKNGAFGVRDRKVCRIHYLERGIKDYLEIIKAILEMKPLKMQRKSNN